VHQNLLVRKVPPGLAESTMNSIRAELSDRGPGRLPGKTLSAEGAAGRLEGNRRSGVAP
jgi:hypothetical protein